MKVFTTIKTIQKELSDKNKKTQLGLVPTMGALHAGHLSIIERALKENDLVVVSIFVNPTQFDKEEDLINYPNEIEKDLNLLNEVNCDYVFMPSIEEMYPANIKAEIFDFYGLDKVMEGAFREGHFNGVGTIVKKLFEVIVPDRAYFGEKDFQQLQIIKIMVAKNKFDLKIIPCEIYREKNGLAMSSRNTRLTNEQLQEAPLIHEILLRSRELFRNEDVETVKEMVKKEFNKSKNMNLEYFEIAETETLIPATNKSPEKDYRAFIGVYADNVRLIDNIALN
jgi:pantoate--beta-alanine ligase